MATSPPGTQSPAARRSAEAELRGLVTRFAPAHQRLVGTMRRSIQKRLPTAHELVYEYRDWFVISFSPNENGMDGVLAIRGDTNGVQLYFNRGKGLADPEKLLKGSAKLVRFIEMEGASTLARPAVVRLIDAAIAGNRIPFARTGRGPVIIRSAAAKTRAGRRPTNA